MQNDGAGSRDSAVSTLLSVFTKCKQVTQFCPFLVLWDILSNLLSRSLPMFPRDVEIFNWLSGEYCIYAVDARSSYRLMWRVFSANKKVTRRKRPIVRLAAFLSIYIPLLAWESLETRKWWRTFLFLIYDITTLCCSELFYFPCCGKS